jgi:hypothetical protein
MATQARLPARLPGGVGGPKSVPSRMSPSGAATGCCGSCEAVTRPESPPRPSTSGRPRPTARCPKARSSPGRGCTGALPLLAQHPRRHGHRLRRQAPPLRQRRPDVRPAVLPARRPGPGGEGPFPRQGPAPCVARGLDSTARIRVRALGWPNSSGPVPASGVISSPRPSAPVFPGDRPSSQAKPIPQEGPE